MSDQHETKAMSELKAKVTDWLASGHRWVWTRTAGVLVGVVVMQVIMSIPFVKTACHAHPVVGQFCEVFIELATEAEEALPE